MAPFQWGMVRKHMTLEFFNGSDDVSVVTALQSYDPFAESNQC